MSMNESGTFKWHRLLLVLICVVTLVIRYWGIGWPSLHPDEATIGSWVDVHREHAHIEGRFYAEGFFTLLKPVDAINIWLNDRLAEWRAFQRSPEVLEKEFQPRSGGDILMARQFNAWLAVANVVVLYLLILSVTGSRWAGLLGAAWLALTPLHVENSHYAETDIAAVTMLTLSLWLWSLVLKKGGVFRFALAATVTGFAIGTKFTLTPMLFCAVVVAWMPCGETPRPGWLSGILRTFSAILLCIAGVVIANPGIIDWKWFYPHVQSGLSSVYAERDGLGTTDKWAAIIANWKPFVSNGTAMGWAWIGLLVTGLFASCRKVYRPLWPVTFVFPAVFFYYFVFVAPWVRGQEFMLFFPSFAIWAGIGVITIFDILSERSCRPIVKYGVGILVVSLVLGNVAIIGLRRASIFAWPDPRCQALEWFKIHTAPDRTIGFGSYTDPAFRLRDCKTVEVGSVERNPVEEILTNGVDYIIRNPVSHGRGTLDPATGMRFPKYDKYWDSFVKNYQPLWGWATMEKPAFFFACMPVEYWGLIRTNPVVSLDVPLFRPGFIDESINESMWQMSIPLGSMKSMVVSRAPRRMIMGGPVESRRPVYVLLQTLERGAAVWVKGLGQSRLVNLAPYSLEIVVLKRPWYRPRLDAYDIIDIYADPEKHIDQIPCYAEAFVDESMVLARLIHKGYPDKALEFVKSGVVQDIDGKSLWPAFTAATMEGDWALADKLRDGIVELQQKLRKAETNQLESVAISGVSGVVYDDHSRIRLNPFKFMLFPGENDGRRRQETIAATQILPVWLGRGDYELSFTVAFRQVSGGNTSEVPVSISAAGGKPVEFRVSSDPGLAVVLPLHVEREAAFPMTFTAPCSGEVSIRNVELRWRFRGMLGEVDKEISRALSVCELKRIGVSEALAGITERCKLYPDDLDLERSRLSALDGAGKHDTAERTAVARNIHLRAPGLPLDAGLGTDSTSIGIKFYPFFELTGVTYVAGERKLNCSFRVLRDGAPVPRVAIWRRRPWSTRWWKPMEQVLSNRPLLYKGEVCSVGIPLPRDAKPPFRDLALSVRTNPKWVPHDYALVGSDESRVKLDSLPIGQK